MNDLHTPRPHGPPLSPSPRRPWFAAVLLSAIAGCAPFDPRDDSNDSDSDADEASTGLTAAQKQPRYERIRQAARAAGVERNGFLLAGIANDETGLAMCWSEATWACQGPASPDCDGGPIIAGSGDGPCSIQQGGLGMFQFDAGTYGQTIAKYGASVLTVEGQLDSAVDYAVAMVRDSVYTTNAETDEKALAWINHFDVNDSALRDQWIKTVVRYYNGCQPGWSCWGPRYQTYSEGLDLAISQPGGLAFWAAGGTITPAATPPAAEGGQAFVSPNQQHYVRRDDAGDVRHHYWDGAQASVAIDTWGSGITGRPVTFTHGTSQHAFARKSDGSLGHWFWDPVNGSRTDSWAGPGSVAHDPATIVIGDYEAVWAVNGAGALSHWYWGPSTNGVKHDTWGSGVVGRPSVLLAKSGEQHAFVRGTGGTLEHWWWSPSGGGVQHDTWGTGLAGDPAALAIGEFQGVWAVDTAGKLAHWYWGPQTNGVQRDSWGAGVVGRPSVFVTKGGEQHAFVRGSGGTLEHAWWSPDGGLQHDTWGSGIAGDPTAITIGEQQHVWATATTGRVAHWYWDPAKGSIQADDWGK